MSTVLAVSPRRRSNEVLGALLGAVEAQLATKGPSTVPAVLRGYAAANKRVNGGKDWATVLHLRQARTAAEIGRVVNSDIGHTAEGAARIASGLLRLAAALNGLQVKGSDGAVPVKVMYQQTKQVLAKVRQAVDQDVRGELARAGHRV
ncbi:hypothetical protein OG455_36755 [Kitasatospora sp. NBC_01287]|uniref:hypothetical protein n=1 Tax=Kitasatospora sp. NBC_01287 TaxID=2903573 RepID=UPI0022545DA7|nr:hypothetical protein [Kitasatospora sp. NBC_01287]MCX4743920.1 hypothetical protein [Kitasatospora sp. NBC_01287]MCX4750997.1 hypothetical protein [Kitasatospora sp. NBC_01287]